MKNRLDDLFREKLSKHEEVPSPAAWGQIHGQLKSKRVALWRKRLAVAASLLLMATVGFVGYHLITSIDDTDLPQAVSLNNEVTKRDNISKTQSQEKQSEEYSGLTAGKVEEDNTEKVAGKLIEDRKDPLNVSAARETAVVHPGIQEDPLLTNEENLAALVPLESDDVAKARAVEKETKLPGATQPAAKSNSEVSIISNDQEVKNYPKVRIVYKASQNSALVASGKKSILNKGIDKITEFSGEHLLTDNRKTRLRNTKDDLLALNFGKLLNKSNRELEN